jgi:hypothetical protein
MSYQLPEVWELNKSIATFIDVANVVCKEHELQYYKDVKHDRDLLLKIEIRVHQRKDYYDHFHKFKINQLKIAATRAYWVIKYKPFTSRVQRTEDSINGIAESIDFNVLMAFWVLMYSIADYANELMDKKGFKFKNLSKVKLPEELVISTIRSLNECDVSKELLIELTNSFLWIIVRGNSDNLEKK